MSEQHAGRDKGRFASTTTVRDLTLESQGDDQKYVTPFSPRNGRTIMKRIKECIRFPDVGGQDSGKERAENCVALSESRNNGGLRFREVKRNPISSLPCRREGLPVEDRGRESDGKRDERREEEEDETAAARDR